MSTRIWGALITSIVLMVWIWALCATRTACNRHGGTLVQGVVWYECVAASTR